MLSRTLNTLILTNHLGDFGGSELVALEVAEAFKSLGCAVDIVANSIRYPLKACLDDNNFHYRDQPPFPNPFHYDIVWSQHHVLSLILSSLQVPHAWRTYFVVCSLSPFEPLETPGWPIQFADLVLANSPETAAALSKYGVQDEHVTIFHNAAPSTFIHDITPGENPNRFLIVANTVCAELRTAIALANKQGMHFLHIGRQGTVERLTPEHLSRVDAVITTGKTVQYAVLAGRPVYVYGEFGGPGWLTPANLEAAEFSNFSGRCCRRKLTAEKLVDEWLNSYGDARAALDSLTAMCRERYRLESHIDRILHFAEEKRRGKPTTIHCMDDNWVHLQNREGQLAHALRRYHRDELLIHEIKSSLSWKITAPVRTLVDVVIAAYRRLHSLLARKGIIG